MAVRSFKALAPSQMLTLISKLKFIAKIGENAINLPRDKRCAYLDYPVG